MIETIQWIFEKNNPQGTPSWWLPKELRRPFFFLIGIILIVCGI